MDYESAMRLGGRKRRAMAAQEKKEYNNQTQRTVPEKSIQSRVRQPAAERNEGYEWRAAARQRDAEASWWRRDGNTTFLRSGGDRIQGRSHSSYACCSVQRKFWHCTPASTTQNLWAGC